MKVIITGASGFVGANMVEYLSLKGYDVFALGRKFKKKRKEDVKYFEIDLLSPKLLNLKNEIGNDEIDVLIHAAGQAHISQTAANREKFINNNVIATQNVLNLAINLKVKKIIFISSIAVLNGLKEDIYGCTKRKSEKMVVDFCEKWAIKYTIIRPVLIYGENDEKGNMARLIRQIKRGFFPLINFGRNMKSVLYMGNLSYIILQVLETDDWNDSTLTAKDKSDLTFREICCMIKEYFGNRCIFMPIPLCFLNFVVRLITIGQRAGLFHSINAMSIKRLAEDMTFGVDGSNKFLLEKLPYTTQEGLTKTLWFEKNEGRF